MSRTCLRREPLPEVEVAGDVGQAEVAPLVGVGELLVVDAQAA